MPLKDPEARRIWVNAYTRRRRADPKKKARQDELRRARYPLVKDMLNERRRRAASERSAMRPKTPPVEPPIVPDIVEVAKARRVARANEARERILEAVPRDGTVHRLTVVARLAQCSRPTLREAIVGTDIQTMVSGDVTLLYRMP